MVFVEVEVEEVGEVPNGGRVFGIVHGRERLLGFHGEGKKWEP